MSSPAGRCSRRSARGQEADPSDVFAFAALRPADERDGELWLTGRPRRGEDDEEARTLLERCDGIEVDGLRFSLSDLGRGEAILRISGGADDRVTDSDAFFRDWYPVLRPQPVVPEAERTARAADEWMREVLRRLEGERFNVITLKWWGRPREAPTFAERHGLSGTFIAASRFMHGLARAVGLEPLEAAETEDATADLARRVDLIRERLDAGDTFVFSHQKATDEAGHTKDPAIKQRTIEALDASPGRSPHRSSGHLHHRRPCDACLSRRHPLGRSGAAASWRARESAPTESPPSASCPAPQASSATCEALT